MGPSAFLPVLKPTSSSKVAKLCIVSSRLSNPDLRPMTPSKLIHLLFSTGYAYGGATGRRHQRSAQPRRDGRRRPLVAARSVGGGGRGRRRRLPLSSTFQRSQQPRLPHGSPAQPAPRHPRIGAALSHTHRRPQPCRRQLCTLAFRH